MPSRVPGWISWNVRATVVSDGTEPNRAPPPVVDPSEGRYWIKSEPESVDRRSRLLVIGHIARRYLSEESMADLNGARETADGQLEITS